MSSSPVNTSQAGDAFYTALRVAREALDLVQPNPAGDFRASFVEAFRTMAVYVAEADGALSVTEVTALDQIFWLDRGDSAATGRANADDPARIETTIQYLCNLAITIEEAADKLGKPVTRQANALALACDFVFRAILGADNTAAADTQRAESVMLRLSPPSELAPQVARPVTADASAVPVIAVRTDLTEQSVEQPQIQLEQVECKARLRAGEICYANGRAVLFQEANVVRNVRYGGLSARVGITRRLSYRAGTYSVARTRASKIERIAEGRLYLTSERLIFLSDVKNIDLPYARLLSSETGPDYIEVTRSNSGRLLFQALRRHNIEVFEQVTGTSPETRLRAEGTVEDQLIQRSDGSSTRGSTSVASAFARFFGFGHRGGV